MNIKSFYEILFKSKKTAFEKALKKYYVENTNTYNVDQLGSDIRTANNNRLMHPYDTHEYQKIYMPVENKFMLYYLDQQGNITTKPSYNKQKYKNLLDNERIGIEFRIFDHFPTQYMNQILSILQYLVIDSLDDYPIQSIHNTFVSKQFWHNEMAHVILQGYKHNFTKSYVSQLNQEFSLDIVYKKNSLSSNLLLEEIYNGFEKKYKNKRKNKIILNKLKMKQPIDFISINEYASKIIMKSN